MIFYELELSLAKPLAVETTADDLEDEYMKIGKRMNAAFKRLDGCTKGLAVYTYSVEKEKIRIVLVKTAEENPDKIFRAIQRKSEEVLKETVTLKHYTEITVENFRAIITEANSNCYVKNDRKIMRELKLDFEDNCTFHVEEAVMELPGLSLATAKKKAKELLVSVDYLEEMERIYSKENVKEFYCHPVHYHVSAEDEKTAKQMIQLLIQALQKNGRLLGRRVSRVMDLKEQCYDESDFENLICNSQGATVILTLNFHEDKRKASSSPYEEAIHYISKIIKRYHKKVLFIFQEITSKDSVSKSMMAEVEDTLRIIRVSEGAGNRKQALHVLRKMISKSEYAALWDEKDDSVITDQDSYTLSDIYRFYDLWVGRMVYQKAYKAYGFKEKVEIKEDKVESNAYVELQKMIGLTEMKALVDQIIAMYAIQKKRLEMGMEKQQNALHMIFTGNPGSAKTTVARLLASILYDEGIIKNRKVIECGRGDLVGKYVGWTARLVRNKFAEAKGGILFIDEAYSLVDDRNGSFGDEAINTIVQEMENRREEVIVILAGYPEKMETFLQKNEGLRSRIAFHLHFSNYNTTELIKILELMIKQKGFHCEPEVFDKCEYIFKDATTREDFGNGRYVRNLLEQAILRQSKRLMKDFAGAELDQKEINHLKAEDFEVPTDVKVQKTKSIGFCIS